MKNEHKEALFHVTKRDGLPFYKAVMIRLVGLILALITCGLLIYSLTSLNPVSVYIAMYEGALGTTTKMWTTIRDSAVLLCVGIGLAPAFRMKFWNIGAEGQILVGGIVTAALMIYLGDTFSTPVMLSIMFITSAVAGGIWAYIPAFFKSKFGTNETLFTLMMNYVAIQITSFCVSLWENPPGSNSVGVINPYTGYGWFPSIFGQKYMLNVLIVLALAIFMFIYMKYTKQGYEIAVVGESENTAKYAGINVGKVIRRTMFLSGAVCGVAGYIVVSGAAHTISTSTANGRGFTAIIVAWLAKFNPIFMALISFMLIFLDKGASEIATRYNLNGYASQMITGIILFFILGTEFFVNYKLNMRAKQQGGEAE